MEGLNNLMQNKMFLQYLAAAGQDIGSGNAIGTNVNQSTQQNIAAQSQAKLQDKYIKLLQQMLSGQVPEGGKIVTDSKGMKLDIPHSALGGNFFSNEDLASMKPRLDLELSPQPQRGISPANPFDSSQLEISPSDLAGLNPQDIGRALEGAMGVESLKQRKFSDVIDAMYKKSLMDKYRSEDKDRERTAAIKNYEYAVQQGYKGNFADWEKDTKTTHQKDYDAAKEGGYRGSFHEWLLDVNRASAPSIRIGEKVDTALALSKISGEKYFNDPRWIDDIDKYLNSTNVRMNWFGAEDEVQEKAATVAKYVENKIAAGGGEIVEVPDWDGKTITWKVKWPSGNIEELRYAVSD